MMVRMLLGPTMTLLSITRYYVLSSWSMLIQEMRDHPLGTVVVGLTSILLTFAHIDNLLMLAGVLILVATDTMVGALRALAVRQFRGDVAVARWLGKVARAVLGVGGGFGLDIVMAASLRAVGLYENAELVLTLTPGMKVGLLAIATVELLSLVRHSSELDMHLLAVIMRRALGLTRRAAGHLTTATGDDDQSRKRDADTEG